MFCDDVVCDNGEVFVPLFCLFDMFEAEKFPFKFKGKSLKKYISFASAPLFSLFREGGAFPASFPPPIKEREEERGKPNEDTVHHSKQSESIQNQLCVRGDIHTFLQIVL